MEIVTPRWPMEWVDIDRGQLARLGRRMEPGNMDRALDGALEELACRLYRCGARARDARRAELALDARRIAELARITGLVTLAGAAQVLEGLCSDGAVVELAAVADRVGRLGESSILALWDIQDLSI